MSFAIGLFAGMILADSARHSSTEPDYESAYFDEEKFKEDREFNRRHHLELSCPVSFHEFGTQVKVANQYRSEFGPRERPSGVYQGLVENRWTGTRPSGGRCEESLRAFLHLQAEGIKSASLEKHWFSDRRYVKVQMDDGRKERVELDD